MRRAYMLYAIVFCALAIAGCSQSEAHSSAEPSSPTRSSASVPSPANVEGKGPIEALALANQWMGNGVTSYVTTQSINFEFPGGGKASVGLPADKMVVAIAPYINKTHPCETHSMSGCQGELVGVPVEVTARLADGTVVVDETLPTMANGFVELWLPRDREVTLTFVTQGKSGNETIGTFVDSRTCITTIQLM